jgi:hypothetical protein
MLAVAIASLLLGTSTVFATPPGSGRHFDCSDNTACNPPLATSCATDDSGCVPDNKDHLKCSDTIGGAFGKAIKAVAACHKKQADAALKGTAIDDEACEQNNAGKSAKEKLDAAILKITPSCTAAQLAAAAAEEAVLFGTGAGSLDAFNGGIYCDGAFPIDAGTDDPGTVDKLATDAKTKLKCADTVGKEIAKLAAAAITCHKKMADAFIKGKEFDEEACEEAGGGKAALEKYGVAMGKINAICTQPCLSAVNRAGLGTSMLLLIDNANDSFYPCPPIVTTTTTTVTTTTCPPAACSCAGGTPTRFTFTTGIGSGLCGHLDGDGDPDFYDLACGGLYFGGSGDSVPLPATVPDYGASEVHACCSGNTITLTGSTQVEAGGNHCVGGCNHQQSCTTNADCPGGKCNFFQCTNAGCLYGAPLPIPNGSHNGAATSTCNINSIAANAFGHLDCSTGATTDFNLPLKSTLFLDGDLMPMRCSGGTNPGANCTGLGGCGTTAATCTGGGTCTNDNGRCASGYSDPANTVCCSDNDCSAGAGSCERGACTGGSNANFGCITDADCPGGTCKTFIQVCPICNATLNVCQGGPNDGLGCTPGDTVPGGDFPTSHDCPPPPSANIGSLPVAYLLTTGTTSKTSVNLVDQNYVFCGFCRNLNSNQFKDLTGNHDAVPCTSNADCAAFTTGPGAPFTSCGQRTAGAFVAIDSARTIVETGSPAGALTTGGPAKPSKLASIFCIPPTFNALVDGAADLPGPGAVVLDGSSQLQ